MNTPEQRGHDRQIRVFISSTFRDMQFERDVLVKRVFPQLRKLCEERAVAWTEVDLRWGITEKESSEGKVLPLCLAEIERCRPYFIGLLGERYGWVPEPGEISRDLSIFYFRDPDYLKRLPADAAPIIGLGRETVGTQEEHSCGTYRRETELFASRKLPRS